MLLSFCITKAVNIISNTTWRSSLHVTTPTCVYIWDFFDQNSTCIRMSGLPYRLTNTLPHWHGTKTNDYAKTANEWMVEQIQKVNVTRRPFTALTQSRRPNEKSHVQPTSAAAAPSTTAHWTGVDSRTDPKREQRYTLMASVSWRETVLLLITPLVLRIRSVLTFSRSL
jgi:hypothetical protein